MIVEDETPDYSPWFSVRTGLLSLTPDAHSCTRALQYALKHPLVLPDATQHSSSLPVHARGEYLKKKVCRLHDSIIIHMYIVQCAQNYMYMYMYIASFVFFLFQSSPSPHRIAAAQHPNANVRELQVVLDDIRTHCNTLETNLGECR